MVFGRKELVAGIEYEVSQKEGSAGDSGDLLGDDAFLGTHVTRDVASALIVFEKGFLSQFTEAVCLEVDKRVDDKGTVCAVGHLGNFSCIVDADIFEMVEISQNCIINNVDFSLDP